MAFHTQTAFTVGAKDSFLKNPDLLAETFSHLKNDKSYRCLSNAALTCKDFLDVALDALWEELGSMTPLLNLLPALQVEGDSDERVCANVHVFLYGFNLSLGPYWKCVSGRLG